MASVSILKRALVRLRLVRPPRRILELGAGDGTLLLRLARALHPQWTGVTLTLLDRQDIVSSSVREEFGKLDWQVNVVCADALEWAKAQPGSRYDLCMTTLFLHHFETPELRSLLAGVASHCDSLIACEPRRSTLARIGSRLVAVLGANEVTREDAVKSVAAGFTGKELTALWPRPADTQWVLDEYPAWPFTHCFVARRRASSSG